MPCAWRSNRNIMIRLSLLLDGVGRPPLTAIALAICSEVGVLGESPTRWVRCHVPRACYHSK